MKRIAAVSLRLKGFRHPQAIIAYVVWAYHRFALSAANVEDLLAQRGVIVSRETVRLWVNHFRAHFAACIRRDCPSPRDKWHMDEMMISIGGRKFVLWRAIDAAGDVLDILVQERRNAKAAKRLLRRLVRQYGQPRVIVSDKLRSYGAAAHVVTPGAVKVAAPNAEISRHPRPDQHALPPPSLHPHIDTLELTPSACGTIMPLKCLHE